MDEKNPKRRKKVYSSFRESKSRFKHKPFNKQYPVIYLAGNYLSDSDFKIGDTIEITLRPGKIVITKAPVQ